MKSSGEITVSPVQNDASLWEFIRLPYRVYRADPYWVAPLLGEVRAQFDPRKNPTLDHCEHALFLLRDGDQVVGRVAAFIDRLAMEHWGEERGKEAGFQYAEGFCQHRGHAYPKDNVLAAVLGDEQVRVVA